MQHVSAHPEGLPGSFPSRACTHTLSALFWPARSQCTAAGLVRSDVIAAGCDAEHELTHPEGPAGCTGSRVLPPSQVTQAAPPAQLIAVPLYKAQQPLLTSLSSPGLKAKAP